MLGMRRREFMTLLGGAAAAWPLAARAEQGERIRRIGVLMGLAAEDAEAQERIAAFAQALQELGWTDGRNLQLEYRRGAGDPDLTRKYAAELVALAPDVILASGGTVVGPLLKATRTVPIVFTQTPDPVAAGFVASLARTLAAQYRLPAVYSYRYFATGGGLISYGPDPIDQYRRAAGYVDRILKGEKPADLPVQAPTKFELAINLKTAKGLGLTVPPALLARADEVIE
jgi:ABC-type uncharacterized transport system substrate-binding protein